MFTKALIAPKRAVSITDSSLCYSAIQGHGPPWTVAWQGLDRAVMGLILPPPRPMLNLRCVTVVGLGTVTHWGALIPPPDSPWGSERWP